MAEIKYESKIGQIVANDVAVFRVLSNLENINRFRDVIPQDKIKDMDVLVINALRQEKHFSHFSLAEALEVIDFAVASITQIAESFFSVMRSKPADLLSLAAR